MARPSGDALPVGGRGWEEELEATEASLAFWAILPFYSAQNLHLYMRKHVLLLLLLLQ